MSQVILLSLTASLNPTLVAATTSSWEQSLWRSRSSSTPAVTMWLLEVPLASFLVAPGWTPGAIERAERWVNRLAHVFAVRGSAAVGVLLVIMGLIGLLG